MAKFIPFGLTKKSYMFFPSVFPFFNKLFSDECFTSESPVRESALLLSVITFADIAIVVLL